MTRPATISSGGVDRPCPAVFAQPPEGTLADDLRLVDLLRDASHADDRERIAALMRQAHRDLAAKAAHEQPTASEP